MIVSKILLHICHLCALSRVVLIAIHAPDQQLMTCWSIHMLLAAICDVLLTYYVMTVTLHAIYVYIDMEGGAK